jgi:hypothetical protein
VTLTLHPVFPAGWIIAMTLILAVCTVFASRHLVIKQVGRRWIAVLAALRVAAILLFVLCCLRPRLSYSRTVETRPGLLVLLDTSASMGLACTNASPHRLARALEVLERPDLRSHLLDPYETRWYAFDQNVRSLSGGAQRGIKPKGDTTRLAAALETAWMQDRGRGRAEGNATRILLVSDGNDTGRDDPVETARRLGAPIDTLLVPPALAERREPKIEIAGVQMPGRILAGSDTRLLVSLRQESAAERPLTLTLSEENRTVLTHDFEFGERERERRIAMTFRPAEAGIRRYTISVLPGGERESSKPPATYTATVQVENRRNEVLMLQGTWRWDFKYLRRVMEADPNFAFTGFLPRGSGLYMQYAEPDRRVQLAGFPRTRAELSWFDIVILGDPQPDDWPDALAPALYDLVVNDGKSLVVIAGPHLSQFNRHAELRALLPVELGATSARPVPGPIQPRISIDGAGSPLFFAPSAARGRQLWSNLPLLDQVYAPVRKQPAATVLLEAARRANDHGRLILAAMQPVGRGRVLYLGSDVLWKWQMLPASDEAGNTPFTLFWQQALRAMQPARYSGGHVQAWLRPDRTRYRVGETMGLTLEVDSPPGEEQPTIEASATLPDGRTLPLLFTPIGGGPSRLRAEYRTQTAGSCRVEARVLQAGMPLARAETVLDVVPRRPETEQRETDLDLLEGIANATGGRLIDPDHPASWPPPREDTAAQTRVPATLDGWQHGWLPAMLILVLGIDWLIRLIKGYV